MMAATHRYPFTPTSIRTYRRRALWRKRLAVARRVGRWVARQVVALFWIEVGRIVLAVGLLWRMG